MPESRWIDSIRTAYERVRSAPAGLRIAAPLVLACVLAVAVALHDARSRGGEPQPVVTLSEVRLTWSMGMPISGFVREQIAEATQPAPVAAPVAPPKRSAVPLVVDLSKRPAPKLDAEQSNLAVFIARRYRVALDNTRFIVDAAYHAAREYKLDPWLVLAVAAVESSFNPHATSHKGAQGLMQVLTAVHAEKYAPFGGVAAAFDPIANFKVGARILREYIARDGSVEGALKSYVGAALLPDDRGYGDKVLAERERLAAAATGKPLAILEPRAPTAQSRAGEPAGQASEVTTLATAQVGPTSSTVAASDAGAAAAFAGQRLLGATMPAAMPASDGLTVPARAMRVRGEVDLAIEAAQASGESRSAVAPSNEGFGEF